jgi:hypothetical protein
MVRVIRGWRKLRDATGAGAMRRGERCAPPHHQTRFDGLVDLLRKLCLMLAPSGRTHRAQQPFVDD